MTEEHHSSQPQRQDPDVDLMIAFQQGDKEAFARLMTKYYPRLLNFIYRYTGSREAAEDLTQEVFIKVYNNAARYQPLAKFNTWLFTIAKNVTLNELRKRKQKTVSLDQSFDTGEGEVTRQVKDTQIAQPDDAAIKEERAEAIQRAIITLPEQQRTAVLLRRYEKLSYEEIAKTMGTTDKAVKSLLNRAKENLKNKLAYLIRNEES